MLGTCVATAAAAIRHRRKLAASRVYASTARTGTLAAADSGPIPAIGTAHRRDPAASLTVEVYAAKFVVCLFVVWCLFVLPFPVLSLVRVGRTAVEPSKPFTYTAQIDALVTGLFVTYPLKLHILPGDLP